MVSKYLDYQVSYLHKTNPKIESYDLDFAKEHLQKVGELAKSYNQRLTFHPGQFNVLATLNKSALKMTLNDLMYHSQVLDMMGLGKDPCYGYSWRRYLW